MTTQFKWSIFNMSVTPEREGKQNVVFSVGCRCEGTSDNGASAFEIHCGFEFDPAGAFTPYEQLTEQQVLEWAWASGVEKDQIEAQVQRAIDTQSVQQAAPLPMPWSQVTSE